MQQQQRRDSAKQQQLRQIYAAREIYDAVAGANSALVIGQSGPAIVQPLAAGRASASKPAHQFYKDLGRQRAEEQFYDE